MIDSKARVFTISSKEFTFFFDHIKVNEIMMQERESVKKEENHIVSNINVSNEAPIATSKEITLPFDNETIKKEVIKQNNVKAEEIEISPDIQTPEHMTPIVTSPSQQLLVASHNEFSRTMTTPQVLQACQNYDFRYQRELLKSGVTLNLNPDDCLDQALSDEDTAFRLACAKYMKDYHRSDSQETEEQAAIRRAQNALRMRNYRQSLRVVESDEQAAERRAQNALRMRNYRRFKRELEPELAAERRAQNAERMRKYRKVIRELEPETAALRRAQNALRMRNYRKSKRHQDPE